MTTNDVQLYIGLNTTVETSAHTKLSVVAVSCVGDMYYIL